MKWTTSEQAIAILMDLPGPTESALSCCVFHAERRAPVSWFRAGVITLLTLALSALFGTANAQTRVVKVGAYHNPPKIELAADGQVTGFWPDLLAQIAASEDWRIEYVPGTWAENLQRLQEGIIEVMPDVAYTDERAQRFSFSAQPVLLSWTRLYVRQDNETIQSIQDLQNKRVAALRASVNLEGVGGLRELMRSFDIQTTFVELDDYNQVFDALAKNQVDASITNRDFGDRYAESFQVKATPIIFQPTSIRFAFPKGASSSDLLREHIDARLKTMKSDNNSGYFRLLAHYFEAEIAEKRIEVVPSWFRNVLGIAALMVLGFGFTVIFSRSQVARNTRQLRHSNRALAAEKERLSVTLASIGDAVIATDIDGVVVLLNRIASKLTGWNSNEAVGQPLEQVFRIVDGRSYEPREDPVEKVLRSGNIETLASHTTLIARDGTRRNIADSAAPIRDVEGATLGVILVFRDISERLRTEQELLKIRKLESVGVLAGGIAHDFNNILAAILGYTGLALLERDTSDALRSRLQEIEKAANRATGLTQQLLTFAKGGEPVKQIASITTVIRDSADFVLRGSNVHCTYQFDDNLWSVEIDQGQISQVIQNLIINAAQSMPAGGVIRVTCGNHSQQITDALLPAGRYVRIGIRDQGIGIPAELCERIFDPFFTTKQEGSGLGLAITHSIISRHDGRISVESVPGAGTTFTIDLPATTLQPLPSAERITLAPGDTRGKILVMDDDDMMRELATDILTLAGHQVTTAREGAEALGRYLDAASSGAPFDLVILDLTVRGGMGGLEAARSILGQDPQARIIVASGYSNDEVMAHYHQYGFRAAIAKPYDVAVFTATVASVLAEPKS